MKAEVTIIWVDDNYDDRVEDEKNIEARRKELHIILITPDDIVKTVSEYRPDLFLVDFRLDEKKLKDGERYPYKGLVAHAIIREKNPDVPIYGVSRDFDEPKSEGLFQAIKTTFCRIFETSEIQNKGHDILYFDAIDYRDVRRARENELSELFRLLKCPEEVKEHLKLALPTSLQKGLKTTPEGNSIAFAKWIHETLLGNPGFLYNELHTATQLGLTVEGFRSIKNNEEFQKARYTGIFSRTHPESWWAKELSNAIYSHKDILTHETRTPRLVVPLLYNIPENQQSKCVVCGEKAPECVGFDLEDEREVHPVHYRCSEPHPCLRTELYFDEYRGYRLKEH